jgi:hypothetical protein
MATRRDITVDVPSQSQVLICMLSATGFFGDSQLAPFIGS